MTICTHHVMTGRVSVVDNGLEVSEMSGDLMGTVAGTNEVFP